MKVKENTVIFNEQFRIPHARDAINHIRYLVEFRGFEHIRLDFSRTEIAFAEAMVPLLSICYKYKEDGVVFSIIRPKYSKLLKLFENARWTQVEHQLPIAENKPMFGNLPLHHFRDASEQFTVVNRLIDSVLRVTNFLERQHLKAMEWCLNEITDNVMRHSESTLGGFVQLSIHRQAKEIEIVVSDPGIGIPASLRQAPHEIRRKLPDLDDDRIALEQAIKEGVTRGDGQGNGLFGSSQICCLSGGPFYLNSGRGFLAIDRSGRAIARAQASDFIGTHVVTTLSFSKPLLLEQSLTIGGRPFDPTDLVELSYEQSEEEDILELNLKDEVQSIGNRGAGAALRIKIHNLMRFAPEKTLVIDMSGVAVMSSSFADEAFAKLRIELGEERFHKKIQFKQIQPINHQIISRSMRQRAMK